MSELEDLAHLSRRLGAQAAYAQGGGGNTSLKDSACRMWIKASGVELATAEAHTSFVPVDFIRTRELLKGCASEADYVAAMSAAVIADNVQGPTKRPSIETGFHALLGKVVMHSHSVWGNLINCSENSAELLAQIEPCALFISYVTPGLPLTRKIANAIASAPEATILFLQNHGVIVSAPTADEAWDKHESINQRIRDTFHLSEIYAPVEEIYESDPSRMLFPDQAVYLQHETLRHSRAGLETQQAYDFLRQTMDRLNLTPHFLPVAETTVLLNMEAEKYRQKIAASEGKRV